MPTTAEAGYPKLVAPFWLGVVAPTGTPADIVDKLNTAFRESLNDLATRARLDTLGAESRSARRKSSASYSPRSTRCGPAS